ncbi:MAG: PLDc N-terminal domain-containing protein [bacterium]|nr:PLDc N-terminal domain-containing protein [bacterium]
MGAATQPANIVEQLLDLPLWVLVLLGIWILLHLILATLAVMRALNTAQEQLTAPRPVWILISLLVQVIGPVAFLFAGRRPLAARDPRESGGWSQSPDGGHSPSSGTSPAAGLAPAPTASISPAPGHSPTAAPARDASPAPTAGPAPTAARRTVDELYGRDGT